MHGLEVAVVGGGLGGLAAAIAMQRSGYSVTVYEQAEQFLPVGAGISLWPNGAKVLNLLGMGHRLAGMGGTMDTMAYASSDGSLLTSFSLRPLYDQVGQRAVPMSRAELQALLVSELGDEHLHLGCRAAQVGSGDASAWLAFDDGTRVEAELVVGADGTHSTLRRWVTGEAVERDYVGYVNFNTVIDTPPGVVGPDTWITWVGAGRRVSAMPVGGGRSYVFFDVPMPADQARSPGGVAPLDEIRTAFSGWAEPIQALVAALDPARLNRVLIHDLPTLGRWHRGRVVLLGDAAHAMAPDLGQGGCQALEDALVLTHFLVSTNLSVPDALSRYQEERLARTADIVRRARKRAAITHGEDPGLTDSWYRSLRSESGEGVIAGLVESVVTGPCR